MEDEEQEPIGEMKIFELHGPADRLGKEAVVYNHYNWPEGKVDSAYLVGVSCVISVTDVCSTAQNFDAMIFMELIWREPLLQGKEEDAKEQGAAVPRCTGQRAGGPHPAPCHDR